LFVITYVFILQIYAFLYLCSNITLNDEEIIFFPVGFHVGFERLFKVDGGTAEGCPNQEL
jgi:hypothetical protein